MIPLALPTTISHFELAERALKKGIHVFIEKPITETLQQAKDLIKISEEKNIKIQVGHIERFNPVIMEIEDKVKKPIFMECHRIAPFTPRGTDIPVVLELMIHDIDLILSFMDSKVKHISASGSGVMTKSIDIANARIEFEDGAVANITASRISMKRLRKIRFFQEDKYISLDYQAQEVQVIEKSEILKMIHKISPTAQDEKNLEPDKMVKYYKLPIKQIEPLKAELQSFANAVILDRRPLVNGEDGYKALKVAHQIMEKIDKRLQEFKSSRV